jgi:hypothetical protein
MPLYVPAGTLTLASPLKTGRKLVNLRPSSTLVKITNAKSTGLPAGSVTFTCSVYCWNAGVTGAVTRPAALIRVTPPNRLVGRRRATLSATACLASAAPNSRAPAALR